MNAANRTAVADAIVQLSINNTVRYETQSDVTGSYSLASLQAGSYQLVCSKAGFQSHRSEITISDGQKIYGREILLAPKVAANASISGNVQDIRTQAAIANAILRLLVSNKTRYTTTSNGAGAYRFDDIEAGTYQLVASKSGYSNSRIEISISSGEQITGEIILLTPSRDATPPAPPQNVQATGKE